MIRKIALFLAIVLLAGLFLYGHLFSALGGYLVHDERPKHADLALVLAGDANGNRILRAAELVRQGYVPKVLVSGPGPQYGLYECDLAIPFAVKAGYPESYFLHFHHDAHSTQEEAVNAGVELHRLGAKHVLLVTSDFHTRRAGRILRAAVPDVDFTVVSAPDKYFSVATWWQNREGRKTFLVEWEKTIGTWFGL